MAALTPPAPIPFEQALAQVRAQCAARLLPGEAVAPADALGRILAAAPEAATAVPPFDNAAMDGYALRIDELRSAPRGLPVQGARYAGSEGPDALLPGHCLRITTGALLPAGADTVVPVEATRCEEGCVQADPLQERGANIRRAGEDYARGAVLAPAGSPIDAALVAAAAATGVARLQVSRRPRVAVLVTGDELRPAGRPLRAGEIHDSNGPLLQGLLAGEGIVPQAVLRVADDAGALAAALARACDGADLVLSCGGASVGERDLLPALLASEGALHFWRVRMKPGMPVVFATYHGALVLALPGNPVSVFATFLTLARPALDALQGRSAPRQRLHAVLDAALHKRHGRYELRRGTVHCAADGVLHVGEHAAQGSHQLHGVVEGNALLHVPAECTHLAAGSVVEVEPYGAILGP